MSLHRGLQRAARRHGLLVGRHPQPNTLEDHLGKAVEAKGVDLVIDVGAHRGEFAELLRSTCRYQGQIVSFEPTERTHRELQHLVAVDPLWSAHRLALGAEPGDGVLHTSARSDFNSLHAPSALGVGTVDGLERQGGETVRVCRLDDVLPELDPGWERRSVLLKADTQGHDLDVLAGATQTMASVAVLLVEVPVKNLYENVPDFVPYLDAILSLGFDLAGLFPVAYAADRLTVIEYDALLVRPEP